jgi:predicted acylesterase/phospholipase RssA
MLREPENKPDEIFQIGLALAGAISAGAYTAGVLDFLTQALSEWDARRGQPGVPSHRVAIKVIAGASAGAITGALGAVAIAPGA